MRRFSPGGGDAGQLTGSWDLTAYGKTYAVTLGPYGSLVVLCWDTARSSGAVVHINPAAMGALFVN